MITPGPLRQQEAREINEAMSEIDDAYTELRNVDDARKRKAAVLTEVVVGTDGVAKYSWFETAWDEHGQRYIKPGGDYGTLVDTSGNEFQPAIEPNGVIFTLPHQCWVVPTYHSGGSQHYEILAGGASSEAGFWARLLTKCYPGEDCYSCDGLQAYIQYTFTPVTDATDPGCISWYEGTAAGLIAYEVNNIDVVVTPNCAEEETGDPNATDDCPTIVWMRQSDTGNYFLFDSQPRWEFVERTSDTLTEIDGAFYFDGVLMRYNQVTKGFVAVESVWILDATAP